MDGLMKVFDYQGIQVRTVIKNGEPWFVAKDVAEILGYAWNGMRSIEHVPSEWRGVEFVSTPSGIQEMAVLSEQGLYFFLARSDKPKALPFQKWIAGEVIPSIRKTGSYSIQPLTQLQILKRAIDILEEHDGRLKQVETTLQTTKEVLAAHPDDWRQTIVDGIKRIAKATNRWHQLIWDEFYTLLEERGRCDLHRRLDNLRERMEDAGATWTQIHYRTNRLDTIEADPRLREIALAIIKEMVAKYVA